MAQKLSDIKKLVNDYIKILASKGVRVERAILFGSRAKGMEREDSDIDLVVISQDLKKFQFPERLGFLSRATLHIPGPLEVLGYTPEEIQKREGKSIFWDEIQSTGRVIYEAA